MGRTSLWKDYEEVAARLHDGEDALDLPIPGHGGRDFLTAGTLVNRVETIRSEAVSDLARYADYSFDVVSCFFTFDRTREEIDGWFSEIRRVLKPAGRLLMLVPSCLAEAVRDDASSFLIWEMTADGRAFPGTSLLRFMRNPLVGRGVRLKETCWKIPADVGYNMNAFDRDYLNPWLVRGIVSGCGKGRLENPEAMRQIRDEILLTYPADSVDYGAALCGRLYAADATEIDRLSQRVEAYAAIPNPRPHQLRWQISCGFGLAALAQRVGRMELARKWYAYASDGDVLRYSATLGTKVMDACWELANMELSDGHVDEAKKWLRKSFVRADEIVHGSWLNVAGDVSRPVPIAYEEIALVCQKAARAAGMMNVLDRHPDRIALAKVRAVSNAERLAKVREKLAATREELRKLKLAHEALKKEMRK